MNVSDKSVGLWYCLINIRVTKSAHRKHCNSIHASTPHSHASSPATGRCVGMTMRAVSCGQLMAPCRSSCSACIARACWLFPRADRSTMHSLHHANALAVLFVPCCCTSSEPLTDGDTFDF